MQEREDIKKCLHTALRLLTRRDHSCAELSKKLADRGHPDDRIEKVVKECLRLDYLDDARFARGYANQLQTRGYGCRRIRQMLLAKGVSGEVVDDRLEACCGERIQIRDCRKALLKKIRKKHPIEDLSEVKTKLYRFLLNRGFSPAIINRVLDERW